jgi:hypothetical protein
MRTRLLHARLAVCLLAAACSPVPPSPLPHAARPVVELARFDVFAAGACVGRVRHLEIRDPAGPLAFYRIEDLAGRWLGHATPQGRFSRRVPFQEAEQDLGVWALPRGVALLLEASTPVELRAVPVDADARRR